MGVTGLWPLIDSVGHPVKVEGLEGKVLGVDANIWLYKFIRGFREKDNATYNIDSHKLAPVLKRRTLERRQDTRNKHLTKFQDTAMRAIAAQLKAQYPEAKIDDLKIHLPELKSNNLVAAEKFTEEDFDLFYLPPHVRNEGQDKEGDNDSKSIDEYISDSSDDEPIYGTTKYQGFSKIDIHSDDFKKLPPEVRYEILHDIKEKRQRIRNVEVLPESADTFSNFQMQRLKVRRQIQENIEKCEKDICANYVGELGEGKSGVKAYRVHSDATSTLLYRSNLTEKKPCDPFSAKVEEPKQSEKESTQDDVKADSAKSYRPSLKLLFAEKKTGSNFIRLPGTQRSISQNTSLVSEDGPALSPEHDESEGSSSPTSVSVASVHSDSSQATTIIDEPTSPIVSPMRLDREIDHNDELDTEISVITPTESTANDDEPKPPINITIDLDTPKAVLDTKSKDHSVVDLTDSIAFSSDDEPEHIEQQPKKVDLTIDISDDDECLDTASTVKSPTMDESEVKSHESLENLFTPNNASMHRLSGSQPVIETKESASTVEERIISSSQPAASTSDKNSDESDPINIAAATTIKNLMTDNATSNPQRANKVTTKIVEDAKELLRLFGIPYIDAAGEAEAQCAKLEELNLTAGTITDDSDIWLFGSQNVYRYFFSDDKYVMNYKMKEISFQLGMNREYLVCFAMLVGSDYTDGILHVGPVTAVEILSEFHGESLDPLIKFSEWHQQASRDKGLIGGKVRKKLLKYHLSEEFPSRAVYEGYLRPVADTSTEKFSWGTPDLDSLREYAMRNFAWDIKKADEKLLPVMKKLNEKKIQPTIDAYFFQTEANRNPERFRSKRVNQALNKIAKRTAREVKVAAPPMPEEVNLSEDDD